MSKGWKAKLS